MIITVSKNDLEKKMNKYMWIADLMAQTVFSVTATILGLGTVLSILQAI